MRRILLGILSLLATVALAQDQVNFGQNKVQYENFDWRYIQSEHFDVYFAKGSERVAEFTAETAENALKQIEADWNYDLMDRVTIITYRSHNNFEQTNVSLEMPEESVGGFTEFLKNRMVFPFTGNYESFRHVIHHELTHAVNMRLFYGSGFQSILTGVTTTNIPLWFTEGLAEYESRGGWDVEADMFMRDASISGYLPELNDLGGYFAYKGGQSVFYYISRKYGRQKVGEFVNKVKNTREIERALKGCFGIGYEEFNRQWQNWLRHLYWPTVADLKVPTDFAERITDHHKWHNFVNNGPSVSPDGTRIVFLSDRSGYFDIWLYDVNSEKLHRLLRGERSGNFEQLKWLEARISWSPDGRYVTFASKAGRTDAVNVLDTKTERITGRYEFDLDGIFNPTWSPDGNKIAFIGLKNGASDIYYYDLRAAKTKATLDAIAQKAGDLLSLRSSSYRLNIGSEPLILLTLSHIVNDTWAVAKIHSVLEKEIAENQSHGDSVATDSLRKDFESGYSLKRLLLSMQVPGDSVAADSLGAILGNVSTGLTQVTDDVFSDDDPAWSPDSKRLLFVSDRQDSLRVSGYGPAMQIWKLDYHQSDIYEIPLGGADAKRLTNTATNERFPTYTPDGKHIIYASDANGIFNLYRLNTETGASEAFTNCLTGCLQPMHSAGTQRLVFSSFFDGGFDIFMMKNPVDIPAVQLQPTNFRQHGTPEPLEESRKPAADTTATVEIHEMSGRASQFVFAPSGGSTTEQGPEKPKLDTATTRQSGGGFFSKKYKPKFTPDYVHATAAYSSFFGAQGTGQLLFSDVLGNQLLFFDFDLYYDFNNLDNANFALGYYYLPHRINYGIGIYRYVYYLAPNENLNFPRTFRDQTVQINYYMGYPFSKYTRTEVNVNAYAIDRSAISDSVNNFYGLSRRRVLLPELAYIHDTALWGMTGPISGSRYRVSYSFSPLIGKNGVVDQPYAEFYMVKADLRDYFQLGRDYVLASRVSGGLSGGRNPQHFFVGGVSNWINRRFENDQIPTNIDDFYFSNFETPFRGGDYFARRGTGTRAVLVNQELRFPLIQYMQFARPLPLAVGNIRGALFTDFGAAWDDDNFKFFATNAGGTQVLATPQLAYGIGLRSWVGWFVLRWDVGWASDFSHTTKAQYFFSIGAEY